MPAVQIVLLSGVSIALLGWSAFQVRRSIGFALLAVLIFLTAPVTAIAFANDTALWLEAPFALGWLALMLAAIKTGSWPFAASAGICAGVALYLHPTAMVTMPLLVLLGAASLAGVAPRAATPRAVAWLTGAFLLVALPPFLRYALEPDEFTRLILRHGLYDATRFNVLQGAREVLSWVGLVTRSEAFHNYFDPALWFLSGTTARDHVIAPLAFLAPYALLIPFGAYRLALRDPASCALIAGAVVISAVPSALLARRTPPAQLLLVAPFVSLLAAHGLTELVSSTNRSVRYSGYGVALLVPILVVAAWLW